MPFNLSFWTKAMILVKISLLIIRVENYDKKANLDQLHENLELLEKIRE